MKRVVSFIIKIHRELSLSRNFYFLFNMDAKKDFKQRQECISAAQAVQFYMVGPQISLITRSNYVSDILSLHNLQMTPKL